MRFLEGVDSFDSPMDELWVVGPRALATEKRRLVHYAEEAQPLRTLTSLILFQGIQLNQASTCHAVEWRRAEVTERIRGASRNSAATWH